MYSCTAPDNAPQKGITVSIEPLRYVTEQIAGNDFDIRVLVPPGSSPETYEPTPEQMKQVANSLAYIDIGLIDFERNLENAIRENMPSVRVINTSENVPLLAGTCGHEAHDHGHGTDPHIWLSPKCLKIMAENVYGQLSELYPDSVEYKAGYERFDRQLDSLDRALQETFAGRQTAFMIFHPALTYLAHDYGLTQIPLENEGKEPSAAHLRNLIETGRNSGIGKVFFQRQFRKNTVDAIAAELGLEAVAIDPLDGNVTDNILHIAQLIANP